MVAKARAVKQEFALHTYVSSAVKETKDIQSAAKLLESWARENDALYRCLTEPALAQACYGAVSNRTRMNRQQSWNQDQGGERVHAHAGLLLDFPLVGGKCLRSARKTDVIDAAEFYETQASDMQFKAVWLRAVAKKLGAKQVKDVFTEEALRKLQKDLRRD